MKSLTFCGTVLVTVLLTLTTYAQVEAPPPFRIDRIDVVGLASVSESLARSRIETKVGDVLNPNLVSRDIRRLYELDFFATITVEKDTTPDGNILTFLFTEERVIDEIIILGNRKQSDRTIRTELNWREGDVFFEEAYEEERDALLSFYRTKGHLNASVDFLVENTSANRVRVTYLVNEGSKARIKSIRFHGNESLSNSDIRGVIDTSTGFLFFGGRYKEDEFEADLLKLQQAYSDIGRLEAAIGHEFEYTKNGKGLIINIYVDEGPEYHVGRLQFADNIVFTDVELESEIEVHAGDIHNTKQVNADAQALKNLYQDNGYIAANVVPIRTLDKDNHTTTLIHRVAERELSYIRDIRITGNSITKDEVIRRQVQLKPGDRYDGSLNRLTLRRIQRTQFFEGLNMVPVNPSEDGKFTDLEVDVEEGRTSTFNFGAGLNSEEGIAGFGELAFNNFDITNFPTFGGGGQQMRARFTLGSVRTNFNLGFTDPQFLGYPLSFGADVFSERFRSRGGSSFVQTSTGGQLRLGKIMSNTISVRSSVRFTDVSITELGTFVDPRLRELSNPGSTASVLFGINRDTSNHFRDPTAGSSHDLALTAAGVTDNSFAKLEQGSTFYFGLKSLPSWSLALRERAGIASPFGSSELVPLAERFYAGGGFTLRGYNTRDVGPKADTFRIINGTLASGRESIGGEARILGTAEIKYKASDIVRLYGFVDGGGVWLEPEDFDAADLKFGAGIGIGFEVPFLGPLRFDYGIPLNPNSDQGSGRFYFQTSLNF